MPYVQGFLITTPGGPDNSLPEAPPGIWPSPGHPSHPIVMPPPPPGIWPPPVSIWPPTPLPPNYPLPPGSIWPPIVSGGPIVPPPRPDQGLPGTPPTPGHPDQGLPGSQPRPDHGLPSQRFLVAICAVSAGGGLQVIGYTVVDPSLRPDNSLPGSQPLPGHELPPAQGRPDNTLPPTAQPRR